MRLPMRVPVSGAMRLHTSALGSTLAVAVVFAVEPVAAGVPAGGVAAGAVLLASAAGAGGVVSAIADEAASAKAAAAIVSENLRKTVPPSGSGYAKDG